MLLEVVSEAVESMEQKLEAAHLRMLNTNVSEEAMRVFGTQLAVSRAKRRFRRDLVSENLKVRAQQVRRRGWREEANGCRRTVSSNRLVGSCGCYQPPTLCFLRLVQAGGRCYTHEQLVGLLLAARTFLERREVSPEAPRSRFSGHYIVAAAESSFEAVAKLWKRFLRAAIGKSGSLGHPIRARLSSGLMSGNSPSRTGSDSNGSGDTDSLRDLKSAAKYKDQYATRAAERIVKSIMARNHRMYGVVNFTFERMDAEERIVKERFQMTTEVGPSPTCGRDPLSHPAQEVAEGVCIGRRLSGRTLPWLLIIITNGCPFLCLPSSWPAVVPKSPPLLLHDRPVVLAETAGGRRVLLLT